MRGYDYLSFLGSNALFANAELRFPLIEAALTPIGVIGGVRGVYDRYAYLEEKRAAFEKLAGLVDLIINPRPNVSPMVRSA